MRILKYRYKGGRLTNHQQGSAASAAKFFTERQIIMKKVISIIISILLIAALAAPAVFAAGEQKTHNYDDYINYRDPLANTYRRLTEDKKLKAVYFGGSVTAGYGSSNAGLYSWQSLSSAWLKSNFPEANISVVNTAIGESGTYLGTYRLEQDVIAQNPDLLFIEYAINDKYKGSSKEQAALQYETIVREVRSALPNCDIVTLLVTDKTASELLPELYPTAAGHEMIAEAYNIPTANVGAALIASMSDKSAEWDTYFTDTVHPTDAGYKKYYDCLEEFLYNSLICEDLSSADVGHNMPEIQSEHLLDGNRMSLMGERMQGYLVSADGFTYSDQLYYGPAATPHMGYYTCPKGTAGEITFSFEGTELAIWTNFYNGSTVDISVDGGEASRVTCDRHAPTTLVSKLESRVHTVKIKPVTFGDDTTEMKIGAIFFRDETKQTLGKGTAVKELITVDPVKVGDTSVTLNFGETGSKDWFVITRKGGTYSQRLGKSGHDYDYCVAGGSVTHELNDPITAGEYEVILLLNDGYTEGGRFGFTVGALILNRETYYSSEKIEVNWAKVPSSVGWAAVYPKDYTDKYKYCDYISKGEASFPSGQSGRYNGYTWPLETGDYTAVFYDGSGYTVNCTVDFSVIGTSVTVTPKEMYVGHSESVTIEISSGGLAANAYHRVRLYKAKSGFGTGNTGFGNAGINFSNDNLIGDATGFTTDANGGATVTQTLHQKITDPGVYGYAIIDSTWDTKAIAFIEIKDAARVSISRTSVPLGANIPLALKVTAGDGGLEANKYYKIRLYSGWNGTTGFGSSGINFGGGLKGEAGVTTDANGAFNILLSSHVKGITETGNYVYCIMDGWNTVARAFFDVTAATDPFPEDAPSVKLDKNTVILGSSEQLTFSVANSAELGLIAGKKYNVRLMRTKDGFGVNDSGFGESGLNFSSILGEGTGITLDENGSGSASQSIHSELITEPGVYAYVLMDGWSTVARVFFEVKKAPGDVNGDGAADIRDLIHLKKMYAGIIEKTDAGDINGDGNLDATDLAELKKILLLK